ncbi:MAG TPA: TetR/AcrR family transcriptional regulator [Candidatus Lachnoclostridium stercorigallinarum]|mgnify:CR=1|uniref:TetR/AcrR family transcriptional regulator n=1 Tax=Candidatus Lachnoclostridium stercorigallinarum TaxID=2838634 RepID=A0A9D2K5F1_9FIRM|nr:TetR/AcrR family transcriptional regulator [Candidatus Lachnoclostridium stercorigallinarum]
MDIRVEKTKRSIVSAFLELRAEKPLEKIRVKELCGRAEINKSTFYAHYRDIFDLAEQLEDEAVRAYLDIPHPDYVITDVAGFVREMFQARLAYEPMINILFSGNRSGIFVEKIAAGIRKLVLEKYPERREDPVFLTVLTYRIYGGYYAFQENRKYGEDMVIDVIGRMAEAQSGRAASDEWARKNGK